MKTQMLIRIDRESRERIRRVARQEGISDSSLVREAVAEYVARRDMGAYVDDLWSRMGRKMQARGLTPAAVRNAVRAFRAIAR